MSASDLTGRDCITVERDGEQIEVFNHVSVSTHHYVNSVNSYDTFGADIAKGDMGDGPEPEAVTKRVALLLQAEFSIDVWNGSDIEVIDPADNEVTVL